MNEQSSDQDPSSTKKVSRRALLTALGFAPLLAACGPSDNGDALQRPSVVASPEGAPQTEKYIAHKDITATVYWIGEGATSDNADISNVPSAWSDYADKDFGGVDLPEGRTFEPLHNTYYVALPASEFKGDGPRDGAYEAAPWDHTSLQQGESLFKGRWVMIERGDKRVYAQWQDVGPCADEQPECWTDYDYVFGDKKEPINQFNQKAGIDVSPDVALALEIDGSDKVAWKFIDEVDVPDGPWKKYPAITNKTNWEQTTP